MLSTSIDGTAILWSVNWATHTATVRQRFEPKSPINDGALSPDGTMVLLGLDTGVARLFRSDGLPIKDFVGHTGGITSVSFSPKTDYILTASLDNTARLWNIKTGNTVRIFADHTDDIGTATFSPDGQSILTGSFDKTVRVWNADISHDNKIIYGHNDRISSVSFSPDENSIISSSKDDTIRLWNAKTLEQEIFDISTPLLDPLAVFSAKGGWIAAGSGLWFDNGGTDLKIVLWQKDESVYKQSIILDPTEFVTSLAFSASVEGKESEYLFVGRSDPNCYTNLWKNIGETWQVVGEYPAYCWDNDVAITPDTKYVAVAVAYDIPIYKIDDATQVTADCVATLASGESYGSQTISFSKDGKYLASELKNEIAIWDWRAKPECIQVKRLPGHSANIIDLAFSPDDKYLLSASSDGTAILWDTNTWDMVRILTGHDGEITSVGFSPDGKSIVTGGADKTIRIWDTNYNDTIDQVCKILQQIDRDFTDAERTKYGITDKSPTCKSSSQ